MNRLNMKYLYIFMVFSLYASDDKKPIVRLLDMQPRKVKKTVFKSGEWDLPEFGKNKNIIPLVAAQTGTNDDKKNDEQAK